MKPVFASATASAIEPASHYDHYYNHSASSSSSSPSSSSSSSYPHHPHHSQHSHEYSHRSPPTHPSGSSPSRQPHHHHRQRHHQYEQTHDHHQSAHPSHMSQHYQSPQQREYPRPQTPPSHYDHHHHNHNHSRGHSNSDYSNEERRAYQPFPEAYPHHHSSYPQPSVRHSEGYEGRVRNTNRDHNDHLLTTDHHSNTHDQQQYHDQYRRDPTYGYLKHNPPSPRLSPHSEPRRSYGDDVNKHHLPPILAPEEPFYRKDLPGRHMRYFRNVTSQDREDRTGYYSSARHVAPSNTTGNHGDGPSIGVALDRFEARQAQQRQMQQQQQPQYDDHRLPSLYTALPEQRPAHNASHSYSPSDTTSNGRSSPSHTDSSHHRAQYQQHSPMHSPAEKPLSYNRSHQYSHQHQQNGHGHGHGYQHQQPIPAKIKSTQPRSIAPAPVSIYNFDSLQQQQQQQQQHQPQQPSISPRAASKRPDRQAYVKIEPKEQPPYYHAHMSQPQRAPTPPATQAKRKWDREHSPVRQSVRSNVPKAQGPESGMELNDGSSQELHLLSRRSQMTSRPVQKIASVSDGTAFTKRNHPKTKMQRYQMTTIRCWHGAIAQKSYGIEKRYLCPPPMVHVSAGVNAKQIRAEQPHVTMSVIHEKVTGPQGENLMEQDCSLDDNLKCSFRNLHVTGTGSDSSKLFKLGLQVYLNKHSTMPTAIMDSNPIPIISKPSKKTAKAGNASCFILNGMSVSLLNRINAQTVRTKYMAVDNNAICAKIGSWSSFTIKMVKPPPAPSVKPVPASMGVFRAPTHSTKFVPIRMKGDSSGQAPMASPSGATNTMRSLSAQSHGDSSNMAMSSPENASFQFRHPQQLQQQEPVYVFSNSEPVLYGSEIVLINDLTGIMTDRLIIRKVENGKVSRSGSGPVSQMQKIVLEHPDRVHHEDGRAYYLSASSIGSPKIEGKIPLQAAMDRSPLLEYRTSSKKASIMDMTDAQEDEEDEMMNEDEAEFNGQNNSMPRRVARSQDSVAVDDFVCWTIAGIAKFDYTYFGPIPASVDTDVDPSKVPTVLSCPRYNPQANTMTMPVKNVFEKITAEEEAHLQKQQDDPYERRLTLSEYVYKRCEDIRQPMKDEEGPVQLWLAQHGPIRMRRRELRDVIDGEEQNRLYAENGGIDASADGGDDEEDESDISSDNETGDVRKEATSDSRTMEDQLPKIATKTSSKDTAPNGSQPLINAANGRYYGGSHLPASMDPALKNKKPRKMVRGPMGLEAELPYACEVRAAHDNHGNAKAELDILLVERASGIAYRTGYKVVYTRERECAEWNVEPHVDEHWSTCLQCTLGFTDYQDNKGKIACDKVVVQAESMQRLDMKFYGENVILILDEFSPLCE
ncbi:hypothetical protein BX616_006240 [Lobosporangium transversale]|nr:hypothetical protein BX616_006240 [Lobosporangium transversale]